MLAKFRQIIKNLPGISVPFGMEIHLSRVVNRWALRPFFFGLVKRLKQNGGSISGFRID